MVPLGVRDGWGSGADSSWGEAQLEARKEEKAATVIQGLYWRRKAEDNFAAAKEAHSLGLGSADPHVLGSSGAADACSGRVAADAGETRDSSSAPYGCSSTARRERRWNTHARMVFSIVIRFIRYSLHTRPPTQGSAVAVLLREGIQGRVVEPRA